MSLLLHKTDQYAFQFMWPLAATLVVGKTDIKQFFWGTQLSKTYFIHHQKTITSPGVVPRLTSTCLPLFGNRGTFTLRESVVRACLL